MDPLKQRLLARIVATGPLTFAEYMEAALYDEQDGFFARAPVGKEFATSAHVSPVFGALVARALRDLCERAGGDTVVDLGAGDGMLTRRIAGEGFKTIAIERSRRARDHLTGQGLDARASLDDVEPFDGVIIANELFDNIPFHVLRERDGLAKEIFVGSASEQLVAVEYSPTIEFAGRIEGDRPVGVEAAGMIQTCLAVLRRGYMLILDYGFTGDEPIEPIRGYRSNQMIGDVLADPGGTDITGPVDFDALSRCAMIAGAQVCGPVTQRECLMALGYRAELDDLKDRQDAARARGDHREEIELFGARGDAAMLVDVNGLGALKVLVLATGGAARPEWV